MPQKEECVLFYLDPKLEPPKVEIKPEIEVKPKDEVETKLKVEAKPSLKDSDLSTTESPLAYRIPVPEASFKRLQRFKDLGQIISYIMRGSSGLNPEEIEYRGLMNVMDDRERARLTRAQAETNAFGELLYRTFGECWLLFYEMAKIDNIYSIPVDGEQRREHILGMSARAPRFLAGLGSTTENLSLPTVDTKKKAEEKGFWAKLRNRQ